MDYKAGVWKAHPKVKTKMRFTCPLVGRALEIIEALPRGKDNDLVFPSPRTGRAMSDTTFIKFLLNEPFTRWKGRYGDRLTLHGFRSTFSHWGNGMWDGRRRGVEKDDLVELALGHKPGGVRGQYFYGERPYGQNIDQGSHSRN
jgi:integrase